VNLCQPKDIIGAIYRIKQSLSLQIVTFIAAE